MITESKNLQNALKEGIKKSVINMMDTDFDQFINMIVEDLRQDQAIKVYGDTTFKLIQAYLDSRKMFKQLEEIASPKQ